MFLIREFFFIKCHILENLLSNNLIRLEMLSSPFMCEKLKFREVSKLTKIIVKVVQLRSKT